jgi:hypothetical protein
VSSGANARFSTGGGAKGVIDPALDNTSWDWVETVAKLGLSVVAVIAPYSPELWANPGFEGQIDAELRKAKLGHLDSAKYGNPIVFYFYIPAKSQAAGLEAIRAALERRGLAGVCKLGCAELQEKIWRIYHPQVTATQPPQEQQ